MRSQRLSKQKRNESLQQCVSEKDKLINVDSMPRELDTFWRNDTKLPPSRLSGHDLLRSRTLNQLTAFSYRDRQLRNIHGLIPFAVRNQEIQVQCCVKHFDTLSTQYSKYMFLTELASSNHKLFYALLTSNPQKFLPVFYNASGPSVIHYSYLCTKTQGMFVTIKDRGHVLQVLSNWPNRHAVRYLVVTNGESVFNMGDLGVNGYAICFYIMYKNVVYGGIPPNWCLPVMLDCGTNNEQVLKDQYYVGWPHKRVTGPEYEAFFEEFTAAVLRLFGPRAIIQMKNFNTENSIKQLELYRKRQCMVDIEFQCAAACGLAALLVANKLTKKNITDNLILFCGDGGFNIGMARICLAYLKRWGLDESAARERIWFCDDKGLICHERCEHKIPEQLMEFKRHHKPIDDLCEIIQILKPNVLVGCSGQPNAFTKDVLRAMEQSSSQPIIYVMSRPTELTECSANDAFVYTKGRCIFISAIELPPLKYANKWYQPGYCTANYILPGITMGVLLTGMTTVPDETFLVAADRLKNLVWPNDLEKRNCFPPIRKLHLINQQITEAVFSYAYRRGIATLWPEPSNPMSYIESMLFKTEYEEYTPPVYCTTARNIGTTESHKHYKQQN